MIDPRFPNETDPLAQSLSVALESITEGIAVADSSGVVIIHNRRFLALWGMPPDILLGEPAIRTHWMLDRMSNPEILNGMIRAFSQDPEREAVETFELKDGRWFECFSRPHWIDGRAAGRVWGARDVTYERLAADRMRESEERFRLIAENVGDLVAMLDPEGRREYNSPSYRHLFEDNDIARGSDSFAEIHPEDRARIKSVFDETVRSGVGRNAEFRFVLKDGTLRHIESEGRVIRDAAGKTSKVVVVSRDITERKRAAQRQGMEYAVTRVLADSETLNQAAPRLLRAICESLDWRCGARWVVEQGGRFVRCAETWNGSPDTQPFADALAESTVSARDGKLVTRAWLSAEPQWVVDVGAADGFRDGEWGRRAGLHAAMAFPILVGAAVVEVLEFFSDEIRQPDPALLQLTRNIGSQIGQFMARRQAEENLLYVATHDTLTGMPNRYLFNQRFAYAINRAQRYGRKLALLFLDLDRFKYVNDTLGHPYGDRLLIEVAQRLRECLRDSDTVARFGGDEFVALIDHFETANDVAHIAQKILDVVRRPLKIETHPFQTTASIGVSFYPEDGQDLATLLKNADIATYRAKEQGRDTYLFHSDEMNAHLAKQIEMESALQSAIDCGEFLMHYQPRVEFGTGRICGMEALIRWRHPREGLLHPDRFISVAESTGKTIAIGAWTLSTVCRQIKSLHDRSEIHVPVSVNLSARQFEDRNLAAHIQRALRESDLAPEFLEIEVTEALLMKDRRAAARILAGIKDLGLGITLDDFGTGYSSLTSVRHFPIDCLKIDGSLVREISRNADDAAIARTIVAVARGLNLRVVAEGVETLDQLEFLEKLGCHEFQGYHFRRAEPIEEVSLLFGP